MKYRKKQSKVVTENGNGGIKNVMLRSRVPVSCKVRRRMLEAFASEMEFIEVLFNQVPKKQTEKLDAYLLEVTAEEETKKREAYFARTSTRSWADTAISNGLPVPSREDLRLKLHAKIAQLAGEKGTRKKKRASQGGTEKKKVKKVLQKQFTSKPNPNFVKGSGATISSSSNNESLGGSEAGGEKTPLRKRIVKKTNGEVVYSKFDFISGEKQYGKQGKPKPSELLKKVETAECRISKLEKTGKKAEAVILAESQKWMTALKRADGDKVRDDAAMLKKTIRKHQKIKQTSQKKWSERSERMDKEKEVKLSRRLNNLESRKEEKKKRLEKMKRKRGRIV